MMDGDSSSLPNHPVSASGFTFLESLIALSILAIAVTLLARVHVQSLRAEIFARRLDEASLHMESLVSCTLLGYDPRAMLEETGVDGWTVQVDRLEGMAGGAAWQVLSVAASNAPAPRVEVCLRPPEAR
jgi:prepilin-type N-terminal cleavage/methylation domain-containing protein